MRGLERLTNDGDSHGANPERLPCRLAFSPLMSPLVVFRLHISIFNILFHQKKISFM